MDKLKQLIGEENFNIGSETWVRVTHIENPDHFYVRPTCFDKFMDFINREGTALDSSTITPQRIVQYKSQLQKKHIRGKIFHINQDSDTTCDIFAIDYGYFEKSIPVNDISTAITDEIPMLCNRCQLANCLPYNGTWKEDVKETFQNFVGNERALLTVREKQCDRLTVDLRNSCPDDIAKMLAYVNCSHMGYSNNDVTRFTSVKTSINYYSHKKLNRGDKLRVRVQSGKDLKGFYVAVKDDYSKYLKERTELTIYSTKLPTLTTEELQVNRNVAVYMHCSCMYERGIIKEVLGNEKAQVQLVDWGTTINVSTILLKRLSEKFCNFPVMAIYCSVDQPLPAAISRLLVGSEFFITIKELGNEFEVPHEVIASVE